LRLDVSSAVIDSTTFKLLQILDLGLVVVCAGRDDDRARRDHCSIVEHELVRMLRAIELDCRARDQHSGSKLLCLIQSACRKFLARNSCWKSEIVFYFGT